MACLVKNSSSFVAQGISVRFTPMVRRVWGRDTQVHREYTVATVRSPPGSDNAFLVCSK